MVTKQLDAIADSAHTDAPLVKEVVPVTDSMPPTSVTPWRKMLSRTAVFGIGRAFSPRGGRVVYALQNLGSYLNGTVLDVGAGANAAGFRAGLGERYQAVDLETSFKVRSSAERAAINQSVDLERSSLPFEEKSFDTVLCLDVLEHLDNIHEAFDELFRVARRYVVVSLPNNWPTLLWSVLAGRNLTHCGGYGLGGRPAPHGHRHKYFFDLEEACIFLTERQPSDFYCCRLEFVFEHGSDGVVASSPIVSDFYRIVPKATPRDAVARLGVAGYAVWLAARAVYLPARFLDILVTTLLYGWGTPNRFYNSCCRQVWAVFARKTEVPSRHEIVADPVIPASRIGILALYCRELAKVTARIVLRPIRRTSMIVETEYDYGHWNRILDEKIWEKSESLDEFLFGHSRKRQIVKVDGRIVDIAQCDYMKFRCERLCRLLERFMGPDERLVELGSGPGTNLLSLIVAGERRQLVGLDLSANAVSAGRRIAAHFGLSNVSFHEFDLTDPSQVRWADLKNSTVLTFFCLEQLPDHIEEVVDRLISERPRRVVHVEPTTERLRPWHPQDWLIFLHVHGCNYQRTLFGVLEQRAREGRIRILCQERLGIAPTLRNEGFVIVWEPL